MRICLSIGEEPAVFQKVHRTGIGGVCWLEKGATINVQRDVLGRFRKKDFIANQRELVLEDGKRENTARGVEILEEFRIVVINARFAAFQRIFGYPAAAQHIGLETARNVTPHLFEIGQLVIKTNWTDQAVRNCEFDLAGGVGAALVVVADCDWMRESRFEPIGRQQPEIYKGEDEEDG
jgi:hypothetical protein